MIISIGSRSEPKIIGAMRAFSRYPELWMKNSDGIEYIVMSKNARKDKNTGHQVDELSKVSCNPMTLIETITGANNRTKMEDVIILWE